MTQVAPPTACFTTTAAARNSRPKGANASAASTATGMASGTVSHSIGTPNTSEANSQHRRAGHEGEQEGEDEHREHPAGRSEGRQHDALEGPRHELLPQRGRRDVQHRGDHLQDDQADHREGVVVVRRGEAAHGDEPGDVIEQRQAEEDAEQGGDKPQPVAEHDLRVALDHGEAGVERGERAAHAGTSFPASST